jgi:Xaa-Pro aminopeptidase
MRGRVENLRAKLEEPLLVTTPANVRYLTGFVSSNCSLVVDQERVRLFTDFRYADAARAVPDVEFVETRREAIQHVAEMLSGRFGFESTHLTYRNYELLRDGGLDLVPRVGLVEQLRVAKDAEELDRIRRAAAITDQVYAALAEEKFVGRSERDLAWRMNELFHELGADAPAFESIVAAGPNGARPHARPTERVIESGTTVVVDAGAMVDGYCADCTRTFATGPLPDELRRAYDVCLEAQLQGRRRGAQRGRGGARRDCGGRLWRQVRPRPRPRRRHRRARGAAPGADVHGHPRRAKRRHDRARHLP